MARYSEALSRLGIGPEGRQFYDVHVAADVGHGVIALDRMVAGLIGAEPHLGPDLLFGAAAVLLVEKRFAQHLLGAWSTDRSSLIDSGTARTGRPTHEGTPPRDPPTMLLSVLGLRGHRMRAV
jgi:hypothetical protein